MCIFEIYTCSPNVDMKHIEIYEQTEAIISHALTVVVFLDRAEGETYLRDPSCAGALQMEIRGVAVVGFKAFWMDRTLPDTKLLILTGSTA